MCLVLLKCARDAVRGKGDATGRNIVSLKRFGFSEPRKISLAYIMESQALQPISSFLGVCVCVCEIKICNFMAETMF